MDNNLKKLCEEYNPDAELTGNSNVDDGHFLAEMIYQEKKSDELTKEYELKKAGTFLERVAHTGLNVNNQNRDFIVSLLKGFGYSKINRFGQDKSNGDKGQPIENAPNPQLYQVLLKTYNYCIKIRNQSN